MSEVVKQKTNLSMGQQTIGPNIIFFLKRTKFLPCGINQKEKAHFNFFWWRIDRFNIKNSVTLLQLPLRLSLCCISSTHSKIPCNRVRQPYWRRYGLHNDIWLNLCGGTEFSCLFSSAVSTWQAKANLAGWLTQELRGGLVARLIGNGNNWPLGSICLMGGIGNQSYCLFGSIPCNSSMEASLSDALCLGCILLSDHTCHEWVCWHRSVNNWEILIAVFGKSYRNT